MRRYSSLININHSVWEEAFFYQIRDKAVFPGKLFRQAFLHK